MMAVLILIRYLNDILIKISNGACLWARIEKGIIGKG